MFDVRAPLLICSLMTIVTACGGKTNDLGARASSGGDAGRAMHDASAPRAMDARPPAPAPTFALRDAGRTPPVYCVAPCMWELAERCAPVLEDCVESGVAGRVVTTCDPNTGWELTYTTPISSVVELVVEHDGVECFNANFNRLASPPWTVTGANGETLLWSDTVVVCNAGGPGESSFLPDGGRSSSPYTVAAAPMRPECAEWVDQYGLPRVLSQRDCRTTTEGTCPAADASK